MRNSKALFVMPFIPIIAYVVADIFIRDEKLSVAIALAIGAGEFIVTFIIDRKPDLFILIDIVLLAGLGGASILLDNPLFFLFKPAIIEALLLVLMIIFTLFPELYARYMKRYVKRELDLGGKNVSSLMVLLDLLLGFHILCIVGAALYGNRILWGFVSSFLLYIVLGMIFIIFAGYTFISKKIQAQRYSKEEWFDILDEEGHVIGKAPRSVCHNGSKILHAVVHIHILNKKGMVLLQKRSMQKDIQPGKWDTAVGGHISAGEKLETALAREAAEELGVAVEQPHMRFLTQYIFESSIEREMVFSFLYITEGPFNFGRDEVDEVRFFTKKELEVLIANKETTENFVLEYRNVISNIPLLK